MDSDADDILVRGMKALTEKLGAVGTQRFISIISREKFDYTEWRQEYFDSTVPGEFQQKALEYAQNHPYTDDAERL
jgi:hypothetical protein